MTVAFSSAIQVTADVIGVNDLAGLAVLRVSRPDLHPATFGDLGAIGLGDTVDALALATGTFGSIVPAVGRGLVASVELDPTDPTRSFVITSALQSPAYYGGPIINDIGEIIAVGVQNPLTEETSILGLTSEGVQRALPLLKAGQFVYKPFTPPPDSQVFPPFPRTYLSGGVTINGTAAPNGTIVYARIGDYISEWREVVDGRYRTLIISPLQPEVIGEPIIFYVNGFIAEQLGESFEAGFGILVDDFALSVIGVPEF